MEHIAITSKTSAIDGPPRLIPACLEGDAAAREKLARWCLPKIRRTVLLAYGNGPDAEDLVQTAVVRVFDRLGSFRGDAGFYAWVDRITVNLMRDYFRSRKSRSVWEISMDAPPDTPSSHHGPDRAVERTQLLEHLSEHLSHIAVQRRLPVVLALAHGYTVPEIAKVLDISAEAAKKRLQRGRMELLTRLKGDLRFRGQMSELLP